MNNGADFLLVDMVNWQIEEKAKLTKHGSSVIAGANSRRPRPWFG